MVCSLGSGIKMNYGLQLGLGNLDRLWSAVGVGVLNDLWSVVGVGGSI
jgi:hypothetical protein